MVGGRPRNFVIRMKAITILTVLICFITGDDLLAEKKKTADSWLEAKHAQLTAVENPFLIRKADLDQSERPDKDGFFSMHPKKGYLKFSDGSWVLLTSHSAHAEDGLPDISLIRTSTGEYYTNRGHCCLPILLFSKVKVISLESFLKTTGKGPKAKPTQWIKYNREEGGADQPAIDSKPNSEGKEKLKLESKECFQ